MMYFVFIFAVLLDGDKNNKFSEWGSIYEIYLCHKRHDLLTADGCCHREDVVWYVTASGLQPLHTEYEQNF